MTVLHRAVTFAAISLSLAGLIATSTPGIASELDRTALPAPVSTVPVSDINPSTSVLVPAPAPTVQAAAPATIGETPPFDTLADAVAAQDAAVATKSEDLRCLAGAIYFESKGEPLAGQLAVAQVIMNRAKSGRFASDVCSVVKQRGQFSFVRGGEIPSIDAARGAYRTAMAVAQVALNKVWDGPAPKALYFHARRVSPGWGLTKVASIGNHVFYR